MTRARSLSQLANSSVFTVATNNRVGIGSEVPTAKLDVDGTLNVSGNATIGGVATYEDVTNVDSVGIVTARSGVSVPDGQKILLGTSNDLEIFHDGTHSYIKNEGSGNLYIDGDTDDLVLQAGDDVRIQTQGNENAINCVGNGAVEIYYNNSKKFETTSTGVSITGAGTFTGDLNTGSFSAGSTTTAGTNVLSSGQINIQQASGSTGYFTRGFKGNAETYYVKADGSATFAGGKTILYTSGNIASNRTDGSNININASSTVALQIADPSSGAAKVSITHAGAATFNNTVTGQQTSNNALSAFEAVDTNGTRFKVTGAGVLSLYDNSLTENVQISSDGSATFASEIKVEGSYTPSGLYSGISRYGSLLIGTSSEAVGNARLAIDSSNGNITSAGSATFGGNVSANDGITVDGGSTLSTGIYYRDDSNSYGLALYSGGSAQNNRKVFIKTDGNATFGPINISSSTGYGAQVDMAANAATVKAQCQQTASSATLLFAGYMGTNRYFHVTAAGAASFGAQNLSSAGGSGTAITGDGRMSLQFPSGGGASVEMFSLYSGTSKNISMFAGGSATFAAQIYSNGSNAYFHANRSVTPGSSQVLFLGETSGSTKFKVTTDGTGTFAGNILSTKSAGTIKAESSAHSKFAALYAGDGSNDSAVLWSSGALRFYNTAERMRLDSSGNLGIGAIPSRKLTVGGDINIASGSNIESTSSSGTLRIQGGSTYPGGNILLGGGNGTNDIRFRTTGASTTQTERMRITNAGAIKITAASSVDNIYSGVAATGTSAVVFRGSHSATVGDPGSGTDSIYIYANGNIQNTNNSYGQISDVKLKENIVDAGSQWDDFKAIRFRKYNFKEETGHETFTQLGVIAQELETVCPGLVYETADRDKEGNDLGTTTKAVKSSILTNKALVALQEAMARIETLEAEVAALKAS